MVRLHLQSAVNSKIPEGSRSSLSTATADFNRDGVPDLAVGYRYGEGGGVGLLLGDGSVIHAHPGHDTSAAPFAHSGFDMTLAEPAELMGAGDFNADGGADLVVGRVGSSVLHYLKGDGEGGFLEHEAIPLSGRITTLAVGDVNRKDGLDEVLLGIEGEHEHFLLVYEGHYGALSREPERIGLPGPASGIAIGHLDEHMTVDIAVATDSELVLIEGRDRRLSSVRERREAVPAAAVRQHSLTGPASSVAIGDFKLEEDYRMEIAVLQKDQVEIWGSIAGTWARERTLSLPAGNGNHLLRARLSANPLDDLLVLGEAGEALHLLSQGPDKALQYAQSIEFSARPQSILPMRLGGDVLSDLVLTAEGQALPQVLITDPVNTWVVDTDSDEFDCNLTDAICDSGPEPGVCGGGCTLNAALENANKTNDLDEINFSHLGPHTPNVEASYPVIIDGTSVQVTPGVPLVEIDRQLILNGGSSVVRNVVVYTREKAVGNILIPTIEFSGGGNNLVEGCYVGINQAGTQQVSAEIGVGVASNNNIIGGSTAATRNVIATGEVGIFIRDSSGNRVTGNYIGTDFSGSSVINTGAMGIRLNSAPSTTLGGVGTGEGNLVSGHVTGSEEANVTGIRLGSSHFVLIQGNLIGTDATGTSALGNEDGIYNLYSDDMTVGGTAPGSGNLISGSTGKSTVHVGGADRAIMQGNLVGTEITGLIAIPNSGGGFSDSISNDNLIGGVVIPVMQTAIQGDSAFPDNLGPRNIFVGGGISNSLWIRGRRTHVQGNYLGIGADGNSVGSDGFDVQISGIPGEHASDNLIGGSEPGARNVIAGSVVLWQYATFNKIQGNFICTDASGSKSAGIQGEAIRISGTDNLIGGSEPGEGNVISGCSIDGFRIGWTANEAADRTSIQGNIIGLDATGTKAIGNGRRGIFINHAADSVIGGAEPGSRNIISGNQQSGIEIAGTGISVQGNFIGTDISGTIGIGNGGESSSGSGIYLNSGAESILIEDNLISSNLDDGITSRPDWTQTTISGVQIFNNKIGTDHSGTYPLPNFRHGVALFGALNCQIGSDPGEGNMIAFNGMDGIELGGGTQDIAIGSSASGAGNQIFGNHKRGIDLWNYDTGWGGPSSTRIKISGNSIYGNGELGIGLFHEVSENDLQDPDTGANDRQNYPELTAATADRLTITGRFNSTPNSEFTMEFFSSSQCDDSGHGEGETYLGSLQVTTDGNGDADVGTTLDVAGQGGSYITATATAADGSTSEFSACVQVPDLLFSDGFEEDVPLPTDCDLPAGIWAAEARDCTVEDCVGGDGRYMSWDGRTWCRALRVEESTGWTLAVPEGMTTLDFLADWGAWDFNDCGDGETYIILPSCGLEFDLTRGGEEQHYTCDVSGETSIRINQTAGPCDYVIIGDPHFY